MPTNGTTGVSEKNTLPDLSRHEFSIFHPRTMASYGVNAALGTLRVPGFQLPDVGDGSGMHRVFNENVHRILAYSARFPALAGFRCFMMNGAMLVSHVFGKRDVQAVAAYNREPSFVGADGLACEMAPTTYFGGSGLDQHRKPEAALLEFKAAQDALVRHVTEDQRPAVSMYVYQSDALSSTLSPEWFQRLYDAYRLNMDPTYFSSEAANFVRTKLVPRISTNGVSISVEEAIDNMRLNFIGQSFGGTFCRMIENCLLKEMQQLNYTDQQIQSVFDNVLVVNVSGACRARAEESTPRFKEIFIEHVHDFICWQTDRSNVHPYFNHDTIPGKWIDVSARTKFVWSNFTWGDQPGQVPRPEHDSYGFHTVQAMCHPESPEMNLVAQVFSRVLNKQNRLPALSELLTELAL